MFYRSAVLTLGLIVCGLCCAAQIGGFPSSRMGQPVFHDQSTGHDAFNSVSGSILGSDNKPLQNVRVELRSTTGSTVNSAYTNSAGNFDFPQVYSGSYQVVATAGLQQTETRVDVDGGMPSNVILRLPVGSKANDGNGNMSVSVAEYRVPEKAREALQKAREASVKGKNDEAQKQVARALELYPKYADALALRAVLKLGENDAAGALADLQEAINDDQNCSMAYMVTGAVFNMQLKFDDAIRSLQRAQSLSPNSWQSYFEMGKSFMGKRQYDAALGQFQRAQALLPNEYPLIRLGKGKALFGMRNYADAVTELQAYLAKEPQGPRSQEAQKLLGQAQAALAQAEK